MNGPVWKVRTVLVALLSSVDSRFSLYWLIVCVGFLVSHWSCSSGIRNKYSFIVQGKPARSVSYHINIRVVI